MLFHMCVAFVPSSSSGAIRLAANFSTAPTRFVDPSTASFTNLIGSEAILVRPPGVGGDTSTSGRSVPGFSTTFGATFSKLGFDAVKNWGLNWWGRRTLNWFWIQSRRKKNHPPSSLISKKTNCCAETSNRWLWPSFTKLTIRFLICPFGYYHILNLSWFDEGGSV